MQRLFYQCMVGGGALEMSHPTSAGRRCVTSLRITGCTIVSPAYYTKLKKDSKNKEQRNKEQEQRNKRYNPKNQYTNYLKFASSFFLFSGSNQFETSKVCQQIFSQQKFTISFFCLFFYIL